MTRADLQKLSRERLGDAKLLMDHRRYGAAYYLCGYVIECALKACIAKRMRRHEFPDKKLVNDAYSDDIAKLADLAQLRAALDSRKKSDPQFVAYWDVVTHWSEQSRYERHTRIEAIDLYQAV